jgi:hypothetical protein
MSPYQELAYAAPIMKAGFSPLWNPLLSCGSPLFGQPGLGLGYPGTLLLLLVPGLAGRLAFLALHAALGFAGARRLAGVLELREPRCLAALLYALGLALLGWKLQPALAAGLAWLPWVLVEWGTWARLAILSLLFSCAEPLSAALALGAAMLSPARARGLELAFFCLALAAASVAWLPALEAARLTVPSDGAPPALSPQEAHDLSLETREYRLYADPAGAADGWGGALGPAWSTGSRRPVAALAAEQALLPGDGELKKSTLSLWGSAEMLQRQGKELQIVRLQAPLRAAFVTEARVKNSDPGTLQLESQTYFSRPLLLDKADPAANPQAAGAAWTLLPLSLNALGESVISLPANHGKGWLFLNDSNYPGWRALADGKARPIVGAEGAFRAVALQGAERELRFLFRPWSFYLGWGISLLALFFGVFKRLQGESLR